MQKADIQPFLINPVTKTIETNLDLRTIHETCVRLWKDEPKLKEVEFPCEYREEDGKGYLTMINDWTIINDNARNTVNKEG